MKQFPKINFKLAILLLLAVITVFSFQAAGNQPQTIQAATGIVGSPCAIQTTNPRAEGLISSPRVSMRFGNSRGQCVISNQTIFNNIETYDSLKRRYYINAKSDDPTFIKTATLNGDQTTTAIALNGPKDYLYHIDGNLTKGPTDSFLQNSLENEGEVGKVGVVFVEGNLKIQSNIDYTGGLVFVVKGNVLIDKSITIVNAVIISSGTIYTAVDSSNILNPDSCGSNSITANQLKVDGSLISLDAGKPIIFCRSLAGAGNSTTPAEIINQQPKYLVIMRYIFAETTQNWSEITEIP